MGDRLYRRHRKHLSSKRVFDGFEPAGLVIKVAEIVFHEADEPDLVADLIDTDLLADCLMRALKGGPHCGAYTPGIEP